MVARDSRADDDRSPRPDPQQTLSGAPAVTTNARREADAALGGIAVLWEVVAMAIHKATDREEVRDRIIRIVRSPIEFLARAVRNRYPHLENTRVLVGGTMMPHIPLLCERRMPLDVLPPLLAETRLPQRLVLDLPHGNAMTIEQVRRAGPQRGKVDDIHITIVTRFELAELYDRDPPTLVGRALVVELKAVRPLNTREIRHRTDAMRNDRDGIALTRAAHVFRRHRGEVLFPRGVAQFGGESRLDDVGKRRHATTRSFPYESHCPLVGRLEATGVEKAPRIRDPTLTLHCDTRPCAKVFEMNQVRRVRT